MNSSTSGPHKSQRTGEPWIDTFCRALAARTSRRTTLKILAAGIFASLFGPSVRDRLASAIAAKPPIPPYCPSCGTCTACNFDTTVGTGTCGPCDSSCPDAQLCAQASQNKAYNELADYLDSQGFQPDKVAGSQSSNNQSKRDVQALLLSTDGTLEVSSIGLRYTNPNQAGQTAELYYTVAGSSIFATAAVTQSGQGSYGLYVDANGQVQKVPPQPLQTQSTHQSTGVSGEVLSASVLPSEHAGFLAVTAAATVTLCDSECDDFCRVAGVACELIGGAICTLGTKVPPAISACEAAWSIGVCLPNTNSITCPLVCSQILCTCNPACGPCEDCFNRKCVAHSGAGTSCNNTCVDLQTDPNNCGSCGHICPSGQTCSNGVCGCGNASCNGTCCNNTCVNTNTDPNNCGSCSHACPASNPTCSNGVCGCGNASCNGTCCNNTCVDLQTDPNNCGSCGHICPSGQTCQNGTCACPTGFIDCNGICCATDPTGVSTCCNGSCCAAFQCCNGICCALTGQYCTHSTGSCCPVLQYCEESGVGDCCCPPGTECCGISPSGQCQCCPTGHCCGVQGPSICC